MKLIRLILVLMLLIPCHAEAAITERGTGLLFGADHAFNFTAPKGWVLDNQSGISQGLHMVFYPSGQTWKSSPVIAYGMSVAKDSEVRTVTDQVRRTVEDFRNNGSKDYSSETKEDIPLQDKKTAKVYFFHGDQWGNYEAAGYIEEMGTINFLVYNAKNKSNFEKGLPAFKSILTSYKNAYEQKNIEKDEATFDQLIREAKEFENSKDGSDYIKKFFQSYGNTLADTMKSCTSYTARGEKAQFDLLLRIKTDGGVSETLIRPSNGLTTCVKALVKDTNHPPHKFESALIYINMFVKE